MTSTSSRQCANPSGSSPAYAYPGSSIDQFGNWKRRDSQRSVRQRPPTWPRSTTTCSRPCCWRSELIASPAWPPPMTTVSWSSRKRRLRTDRKASRAYRLKYLLARPQNAPRQQRGCCGTQTNEPEIRLSENLVPRRPVPSGSSVWLSDGGGLTLYSPVDLLRTDRLLPCRPP